MVPSLRQPWRDFLADGTGRDRRGRNDDVGHRQRPWPIAMGHLQCAVWQLQKPDFLGAIAPHQRRPN
ncbi:hypothetical protein IQ254_27675 [Nodosilinea sp. LEGE 07088]|uniref:hypothetical protein n=1 Tax=Nodosilinea sp. LEGE 07088 TaxID=2777968 RepID=UPI0018807587|nr:hypothetical protein [Nodosilinea sp. LEGE 07088]MBE9140934.1 hypothetical protein [Nodosilinea sp. LEGE 07088]